MRAYSVLEVKSLDDDSRTFEGIATTPTTDRMGDIVEPKGAVFTLPVPLLWMHNSKAPIGHVTDARVTDAGIRIKAQLVRVDEPASLKDELDRAWAMIKSKLVRGLSIGFKPIESTDIKGSDWAQRFTKWDWLELSAVTIAANSEASVLSIKSIDDLQLHAASGETAETKALPLTTPGVSGKPVTLISRAKPVKMTIKEHIAALEATRQAKAAQMAELMKAVQEKGETLDAAGAEEFDTLKAEVQTVDKDISRYRDLDKINVEKAQEVLPQAGVDQEVATKVRNSGIISVKSNLPKATAFTRMCMAIAAGKGDSWRAVEHAKQWNDTPEVELMVKAAVAAGTAVDATWAGPLAVARPLVNEFLELLRPRTLLGRIPGLRNVPFNISVPSQTGGGTYGWVGEGAAKPVTALSFATVTLPFAKVAGIVVLTQELVKFSSPSAEAVVRESMIAGIAQFLDQQFTDPAIAAVANVSPASITNGAGTAASSGVTGANARADLSAAIAAFVAANIPLEGSVWLMNDSNAFGIGISLNALGQPLFPGMSSEGGTIAGRPVIVSNNVGARVILVHAPSILFADDGGVTIDVSDQASVQMDSAPETPSTSSTVLVSLWQRNLVGLRAERFITWIRARTAAVRVITTASPYNGT